MMKNNKQEQRNDAAWKDHLNRWGAYAAAAGAAVALSTNADAEIVYSGIQNITVLGAGEKSLHVGTAVAQIQLVTESFSLGRTAKAFVETHGGTHGLGFFKSGSGQAKRYSHGQAIGGGVLTNPGNLFKNSGSIGQPGANPGGHFGGAGTVDGFVGFELKNGDLGWIQVKVTNDSDDYTTEIEAVDWAYTSTSGGAIYAGQTTDTPTSLSPEPGMAALGLLASGAAGLLAWRRKVG